ncbi:MAG TPA: hypothetical protein VHO25_12250 [Polyangiaceae bacterium]|nr:hypothetical protein [Polyangiaceae bacterium]
MGKYEEPYEFTFEQWLGYEFISWFAYGVLSGLIAIVGWQNFVAGAVALASVIVIGMISWAVRAKW